MDKKRNPSPFYHEIERYLGKDIVFISEGRTKDFTPTFDLFYKGNNVKVVYYSPGSLILCINEHFGGKEKLEEMLPAFFNLMGFRKPDFKYSFERRDQNTNSDVIAVEWAEDKEKRYKELEIAETKEYPPYAPGVRIRKLSRFDEEIKSYPYIFGTYQGEFSYYQMLLMQDPLETFKKIYELIITLILNKEKYSRTDILMKLYTINFLIFQSKRHWADSESTDFDVLKRSEEFYEWCNRMLENLQSREPDFVDKTVKRC